MNNVDFQNGVLVGMAIKGLTKGSPSKGVEIVEIRNGYNNEKTTWILIKLTLKLQPIISEENTEAFRVIGYKDWALQIYPVYEVTLADDTTIALRTSNFEDVDMQLEVYYMEKSGTIKTGLDFPLNDFAGIFTVEFSNPKVKMQIKIPSVNITPNIEIERMIQLIDDIVSDNQQAIDIIDVSEDISPMTTSYTISILVP